MGRAQKNVRLGKGAGPSAQRQPGTVEYRGNGVKKTTGTERPDPATLNPQDMADPQARVIKTRN